MFGIVDRYVAKLFLAYFIGALVVMTSLYVVVDATSTMMNLKPQLTSLAAYYGYSAPAMVYKVLPVAGLIATLFSLSTMNRNNEIVALFSAGYGLARIAAPMMVLVIAISGAAFLISDRIFPKLMQKQNYIYFVEIKKQPGLYSTVKTNKIWFRSKNIIFNLQTLNAEKKVAQGVTFYTFDENWNLVQVISAQELEMNGTQWSLKNGTVTLFAEESSFPLTQGFQTKTIVIQDDSLDLTSSSNSSGVMSLSELRNFIQKNKAAGLDTLQYEVDYHSKFGFAFAAFVMSFIGVPFGVTFNRSGGRALNMGLCMVLVFIYWSLYSSGLTMGKHGILPPVLAAWLPNVSMVALTAVFLLRSRR